MSGVDSKKFAILVGGAIYDYDHDGYCTGGENEEHMIWGGDYSDEDTPSRPECHKMYYPPDSRTYLFTVVKMAFHLNCPIDDVIKLRESQLEVELESDMVGVECGACIPCEGHRHNRIGYPETINEIVPLSTCKTGKYLIEGAIFMWKSLSLSPLPAIFAIPLRAFYICLRRLYPTFPKDVRRFIAKVLLDEHCGQESVIRDSCY
jgi:hypothetical protein